MFSRNGAAVTVACVVFPLFIQIKKENSIKEPTWLQSKCKCEICFSMKSLRSHDFIMRLAAIPERNFCEIQFNVHTFLILDFFNAIFHIYLQRVRDTRCPRMCGACVLWKKYCTINDYTNSEKIRRFGWLRQAMAIGEQKHKSTPSVHTYSNKCNL